MNRVTFAYAYTSSSLSVGSVVLVSVNSIPPLWEIGRLMAIDNDEVAVKILKNNSELSSKLDQIVPLDCEFEGIYIFEGDLFMMGLLVGY